MQKFRADVDERYVWDCPYCGEICEEIYDDPEGTVVTCEHCGKDAECDGVDR